MEKVTLETYNGWVRGKVYKDVEDKPRKYREFCALEDYEETV